MKLASPDFNPSACVLHIRAGHGSLAAAFAARIVEMYAKHCTRRGWKTETVQTVADNAEATKETSLTVLDGNAWRELRHEHGSHRVLQIPGDDERTHVSEVTVLVYPLVERIRTYNYSRGCIKDHRVEKEFPLEPVLDGDLQCITSALKEYE